MENLSQLLNLTHFLAFANISSLFIAFVKIISDLLRGAKNRLVDYYSLEKRDDINQPIERAVIHLVLLKLFLPN